MAFPVGKRFIYDGVYIERELQSPREQVIFNGPATILIAPDGEKTIVKCTRGDNYDPKYGYLLAKFMQSSGMTRTQVSKHLRKIEEMAYED